jgi:AcrR family transcriptional regulator
VVAATALFEERGYDAVSLADVAAAAEVSRPTVTAAFGTKCRLLQECVDQALAGDDEPVPVAERPWFAPVWDARTPADVLTAYAGVCVLIGSRSARIFEVARQAAGGGADAAQLWDRIMQNRRAGARMVVERAMDLGALRPGLSQQAAIDVVWVFNDPALFGALVEDCGWSHSDFRSWLADQMAAAVLP